MKVTNFRDYGIKSFKNDYANMSLLEAFHAGRVSEHIAGRGAFYTRDDLIEIIGVLQSVINEEGANIVHEQTLDIMEQAACQQFARRLKNGSVQ